MDEGRARRLAVEAEFVRLGLPRRLARRLALAGFDSVGRLKWAVEDAHGRRILGATDLIGEAALQQITAWMASVAVDPQPPPPHMTISEFCAMHGLRRNEFEQLRNDGNGPRVFFLGGLTAISEADAHDWLQRHRAFGEEKQ